MLLEYGAHILFSVLKAALLLATCQIVFLAACQIALASLLFSLRITVQIVRNRVILRGLKGTWAIVTGCTDGIGQGIAEAFADRGVNIVVIARSPEKIEATKALLEEKGVHVKTLVADFAEDVDFDSLLAPVRGLDVRVLVNNVGINNSGPVEFLRNRQSEDIVKVNITSTMKITKSVLDIFLAQPQDRGMRYILNIGSMLGFIPSPFQQVYAGTKAFLCSWSEAVASELEGRNVHVELLMTGLVATKLSGVKKTGVFTPSSTVYGANCVSRFGTTRVTYPYPPHELLAAISSLVPRCLLAKTVKRVQVALQGVAERKRRRAEKTR